MPTPRHLHPERNMEPDEVATDLECLECHHEMEPQGGGVWECEWPFCDSNNRDPEQAYENLLDYLDTERRAHNGLKRLNLGLLKCIKREYIHGSAAFNSMVADVEILTQKIPMIGIDWMEYYLSEIRVQIMEWRDEAVKTQAKLNLSDPDKQTRRYSYLGGLKGGYSDVLGLINGKKPEKK